MEYLEALINKVRNSFSRIPKPDQTSNILEHPVPAPGKVGLLADWDVDEDDINLDEELGLPLRVLD